MFLYIFIRLLWRLHVNLVEQEFKDKVLISDVVLY